MDGSGESAVMSEVVHKCTQNMSLMHANLQLISQNDANVRDDSTFADVKALSLQSDSQMQMYAARHDCLEV